MISSYEDNSNCGSDNHSNADVDAGASEEEPAGLGMVED